MTIPSAIGAIGDLQRHPQELGTFAGARNTGKNLNMLGRNLINEGGPDTLSNGNNLGIMSDYRTTSNHVSANAYGQHNGTHLNANASNNMSVRDRDRDLLSQNNVSHSALVNSGNALVNSGNAAILGHSNGLNSFKLNSNNNNLGNGPAALGGAYGAIGANHGLHGPSERERERSMAAAQPQLSRENIF